MKAFAVLLAAGITSAALAHEPMTVGGMGSVPMSEVVWEEVALDADGTGVVRGPGTIVYNTFPAAGQFVYWITGPAQVAFPRQVFDDADLICGPGEPGPARVTTFTIGRRVEVAGPVNFDALVTVWDTANVGGPAGPAGTNQIAQFRVAYTNQVQGVFATDVNITALPGGGLTLPNRDFGVTIAYVNTGTTTLFGQAVTPLLTGDAAPSVGATQPGVAADFDADGTIESSEFAVFAAPPPFTQMLMRLTADQIPPPPPPPVPPAAACVGSLIDDDSAVPAGPLTINSALAANGVAWYRFTLTQDVQASTGGVPSGDTLDIHTDGTALSGAFPTDTVLSLYQAASGTLVASNDDAPNTPPNTNYSALSFGDDLPRASAPSGIILAGEDGGLPRGEYFVAISGFPAQAAPCGWRHTSTSAETGSVRLNIIANLNNTCPGDLDGDRFVGSPDLGILLASWYQGPNPSACGDLNRDGLTNEGDLGALLAVWEVTCP